MVKSALVASFLLCCVSPAFGYKAIVISCHDGDTVRVRHVYRVHGVNRKYSDEQINGSARIRLAGIDAPELSQPFGIESRNYLERLILGQKVDIHEHAIDRYGRTVAEITTTGGVDVNHKLVARGFAWCYPAFAKKDKKLFTLEAKARQNGVGLWASPHPEPPWVYRKQMAVRQTQPNL